MIKVVMKYIFLFSVLASISRISHADLLKPFDDFLNMSLKNNNKIVILGDEDHYDQEINKLYFHIVKEFHQYNSDYNCLFLEHDIRYQGSLDKYFAGDGFENTIGAKLKELIKKENFERVIQKTALRKGFLESLKGKFKVFTYDIDSSTHEGKKLHRAYSAVNYSDSFSDEDRENYVKIGIVYRNNLMAKNIDRLIKKNNCTKSIVGVGTGHMNSNSSLLPDLKIKTLAEHLIEKEYAVQYYNMRSANCDEHFVIGVCELLTAEDFSLGSGILTFRDEPIHSGMFITK